MTTSGVYRSLVDMTIECDCGWAGEVLAVEDREDLTLWWTCPGCGHTETEYMGDTGAAELPLILATSGLALITIWILNLFNGHILWPLLAGGGTLMFAAFILALFVGANRKDHS